ncbi:hypothetical protein I1A_000718 [Pseudomonas fluorescens R124]|uniref:Uncharacterized protein n=1 Tax=Pseudomonas fluorescens R124 TaxID=743713 RepID=A0A7U9GS79_PSEFL|nr:flagellar assembly protein FliX [Pseudomonas fluorescens]EJZ56410.1 hypothetical protein I1A_000718 [Pseudomonas fluorescens R124]
MDNTKTVNERFDALKGAMTHSQLLNAMKVPSAQQAIQQVGEAEVIKMLQMNGIGYTEGQVCKRFTVFTSQLIPGRDCDDQKLREFARCRQDVINSLKHYNEFGYLKHQTPKGMPSPYDAHCLFTWLTGLRSFITTQLPQTDMFKMVGVASSRSSFPEFSEVLSKYSPDILDLLDAVDNGTYHSYCYHSSKVGSELGRTMHSLLFGSDGWSKSAAVRLAELSVAASGPYNQHKPMAEAFHLMTTGLLSHEDCALLVATATYTPMFVEQMYQMSAHVYGMFKMGEIGYQVYEFNSTRLSKAVTEAELQAKLLADLEAQEEARRTRMNRAQKILKRLEELKAKMADGSITISELDELERMQVFA